jgi:hypothetical protein
MGRGRRRRRFEPGTMFRTWKVKENCEKRLKRSKKTLLQRDAEVQLLCGAQRCEGSRRRPSSLQPRSCSAPSSRPHCLDGEARGRVLPPAASTCGCCTAASYCCRLWCVLYTGGWSCAAAAPSPLRIAEQNTGSGFRLCWLVDNARCVTAGSGLPGRGLVTKR